MESAVDHIHPSNVMNHYIDVASKLFGITFDDETMERWLDIIGLTRVIEDKIDDGKFAITDDAIAALCSTFLDEQFLRDDFPSLAPGEDRSSYERMYEIARTIFTLNQTIRQTLSPDEYIKLRKQEGFEYAQLLLSSCSESMQADAAYAEFARNFGIIAEVGILFDSLVDSGKDYMNGEIALRLTWRDKAKLLQDAYQVSRELSPKVLHPRAIKVLGSSALRVVRGRVIGKRPITVHG